MLQSLREEKLPYIVLLTNPTTGGVTASYAMLGDIHIAEPKALIGFAGPRVIENTINENLPEGFQKSEYLLDHGMIDMVVHRKDLKEMISNIINILFNSFFCYCVYVGFPECESKHCTIPLQCQRKPAEHYPFRAFFAGDFADGGADRVGLAILNVR